MTRCGRAYYAVATGATYGPAQAALLPETPVVRPKAGYVVAVVAAAIGIGFLGKQLFAELTEGGIEPEAAVRYALVTTIGTYVLVAALLVRTLRTRLEWRFTPLSALLGGALGGGIALLVLGGDVSTTDPRLALLVSEATPAHVAATVLVAVVAAPLCEEVLFRGLMLESLAAVSRRIAVWASGIAFAAWHLNSEAMVYYSLFGAVFGALYLRRGLACSMAAHAAFNGTLVVAAVLYATGPGVTVSGHGVVVTAPPGWHAMPGGDVHLNGPSASEVLLIPLPGPAVDPSTALRRIVENPAVASFAIDLATARTVDLPVGPAMRVRVRSEGRDGDFVLFNAHGRPYAVALVSGGSTRARTDFDKILRDLRAAS
jgi:membrane protease YdiL (CAAX protease family)